MALYKPIVTLERCTKPISPDVQGEIEDAPGAQACWNTGFGWIAPGAILIE